MIADRILPLLLMLVNTTLYHMSYLMTVQTTKLIGAYIYV